ncbi:MAG: ATPase, partial [Clostridia bacterium]|nr:ATPase [Clostridia bacterium]
MSIRAMGENAYFAASNSTKGFISYYEEIFRASRIGRIYAVKGGPGTGKSCFLRDVSESAAGHGWECEYIYCSS